MLVSGKVYMSFYLCILCFYAKKTHMGESREIEVHQATSQTFLSTNKNDSGDKSGWDSPTWPPFFTIRNTSFLLGKCLQPQVEYIDGEYGFKVKCWILFPQVRMHEFISIPFLGIYSRMVMVGVHGLIDKIIHEMLWTSKVIGATDFMTKQSQW